MSFQIHPVFKNFPTIFPHYAGGCNECLETGAGGPCQNCSYYCKHHMYSVRLCTAECAAFTTLQSKKKESLKNSRLEYWSFRTLEELN